MPTRFVGRRSIIPQYGVFAKFIEAKGTLVSQTPISRDRQIVVNRRGFLSTQVLRLCLAV